MNRGEIMNKLTEVFRDVFDDGSIALTDTTNADDIEDWDSLSHIALISEIEDAFNSRFTMKDLFTMRNVGEMIDRIEAFQ